METVHSSCYTDHQGMALLKENRWPWSPWSAESFQETRKNENQESWSPWSASENLWSEVVFQKKKKNENQQNSHFATFENFSTVAGSLGEMQSKLGSSETDQSMIFQNIINENRLKNSQNFCPLRDFTSRKRNRRNRKRNRPMHQNTNDATVNSFHGLRQQQDHQRWNHVPVLDWSQSNLSPRSIKMNFQNSVRAGSFNERDKNPRRYLYSKRSKFTKASTNVSGFTSEASSRANFKSHNPTNISAGTSTMGNIAYDSTLDGIKSATNITKMEKRNRTQTKSSSSKNLENNEDDVIYLFSVDSSSQDKVILEIDLESNTEHLHSNRNSKEAVNLTRKSKAESATEGRSIVIVGEHKSGVPVTSRKRKLRSDDKADKRPNYMPRCTACDTLYDDVIGKSGNMYISSSCTHVFCGFCISKDGKSEICPACNIKFLSFRRLYM